MRIKRFLAAIMCITLVMGDATLVSAAEPVRAVASERVNESSTEVQVLQDEIIEESVVEASQVIEGEISDDADAVVADDVIADTSNDVIEEVTTDKATEASQTEKVTTSADEKTETASTEAAATVEDSEEELDEDVEAEAVYDIKTIISANAMGELYYINGWNSETFPLATVEIPAYFGEGDAKSYVKIVPDNIFQGNRKIKTVIFKTGTTDEEKSMLEVIEPNAFEGSSITKISLPEEFRAEVADEDKYKVIEEATFKNTPLNTVVFGACPIESIEKEAFAMTQLTELTAPTTLEEIKEGAFANCSNLSYAKIESVRHIGKNAFLACSKLGSGSGVNGITVSDKLVQIDEYAFKNCGFAKLDISQAIDLGKDVAMTNVGAGIFSGCTNMTKITLPNAMRYFSREMFMDCYNLSTINFPDTLEVINAQAFKIGDSNAGKSKLTSITLLGNLKYIKSQAFAGQDALKVVEIRSYVVDDIAEDAFPDKAASLTMKGLCTNTETYAASKKYNYVDLNKKITVTLKFPNTDSDKTKLDIASPKGGDEVILTIVPKSGYTLMASGERFINARTTLAPVKEYNASELPFELVSSDPKAIKFKFIMPYIDPDKDSLVLSGDVLAEKTYKDAEKNLKYSFSDTTACAYNEITNMLAFNKSGVRTKLEIRDSAGRRVGPWRFSFSTGLSDSDVVTITKDGWVTSRTNVSKQGTLFIKNNALGTTDKIDVKITSAVLIRDIDFTWNPAELYSSGKIKWIRPVEIVGYDEIGAPIYEYNTKQEVELDDEGKPTGRLITKYVHELRIPKTAVLRGDLKINTYALLHETIGGGANSVVDATWASGDPNIAKVAKSKTIDNENQIIIPKGVTGETEIRVSVINTQVDPEAKEDDKPYMVQNSFIVNVFDNVPRLTKTALNINSNSDYGIKLPIVVVDDFEPHTENLVLCYKTVSKQGVIDYNKVEDGLNVVKEEGIYYIGASTNLKNNLKPGMKKVYKNLYLRGTVGEEETNTLSTFQIPIVSVTVMNTELKTDITTSGKINLFYDAEKDTPDHKYVGKVILEQSLQTERVKEYKLLTAKNYKKTLNTTNLHPEDLYDADDFNKNFDIEIIDEKTGKAQLTRTDAEVRKDEDTNKEVTSGYILVYYEGFSEPVVNKFTVPTCRTAPSYVLNVTSKTSSTRKVNEEFELLLVNKSNKKLPKIGHMEDDKTVYEYYDILNTAEVCLDHTSKGSTPDLFLEPEIITATLKDYEDPNDASKKKDVNVNKIKLTVNGYSRTGQAVINVQLDNWLKPVKYTFKLKANKNLAKGKMSKSSVTLNKRGEQTEGQLKLKLDQSYAYLTDVDLITESLTYKGSSKKASAAALKQCIKFELDGEKDNKEAFVKVDISEWVDSIDKGTYKFSIRPRVCYNAGDPGLKASAVTFSIVVKDTTPSIKLKTTTFAVNGYYPNTETVKTTYTVQNMPAGDYKVITTDAVFTAKSKKKGSVYPQEEVGDILKFDFIQKDDENGKPAYLKLYFDTSSLPSGYSFPDKFKYKFEVSGLKIQKVDEPSTAVGIKKFNITVDEKLTTVKVKQTGTGVINPIDPKSDTVYKATVSGVKRNVISVNLIQYNSKGEEIRDITKQNFMAALVDPDIANELSQYYYNITLNKDKKGINNQVILLDNPYAVYEEGVFERFQAGKSYRIRLDYTLDGIPGVIRGTDIIIKPTQKLPKLTATFTKPDEADNAKKTVTMFACRDEKTNTMLRINPKNVDAAKIESVAFTEKTSTNIKRAFKVTYYKVDAQYERDPSNNTVFDHYTITDINGAVVTDAAKIAELTKMENNYRKSFKKLEDYMKTRGHYYVDIKLVNATPLKMDKATPLEIETKYVNQTKKTIGSTFKISVTVKK